MLTLQNLSTLFEESLKTDFAAFSNSCSGGENFAVALLEMWSIKSWLEVPEKF